MKVFLSRRVPACGRWTCASRNCARWVLGYASSLASAGLSAGFLGALAGQEHVRRVNYRVHYRRLLFTGELSAQLADARGTTTAKLDAPVNKLARLLNSPSIKRVLSNESLRVSFDEVIENGEVLVVKGALGAMGAGNTSVLMQLLIGMLDAALARRQDGVAAEHRGAVALKVDEAPLVLNRGFAETMALKRSAGLETVACWQTDSQWVDRDVRAQLDALFAHRVYFATASVEDARNAASLMMAEFSDMVRPGIRNLSALGSPDVRLHLPRHSAIASWVTPEGRQAPFVAHTLPLSVDKERLRLHAIRQTERGGRYLEDLSQPHWERGAHNQACRGSSQNVAIQLSAEVASGSANATIAAEVQTPANDDPVNGSPAQVEGLNGIQIEGPVGASLDGATRTPADPTVGTPVDLTAGMPAGCPAVVPVESYRELVDLSAAHSVRWAKLATKSVALDPEALDVEILALIASMRHVLSSQIHRRFNEGRAATTTQRRLKRLSDAGYVARFQFHRRDGGGIPMCYSITDAGLGIVSEHRDSLVGTVLGEVDLYRSEQPISSREVTGDRLLRQARHDVRVAGWVLAVERALAEVPLRLRGPADSVISPPPRSRSNSGGMLAPGDLCLPGGRTPHDFLRTIEKDTRVEVEHFQSVRPDASLLPKRRRELLVEFDDRLPEGAGAAKLERYDHFLSGWSSHIRRYSRPSGGLPLVVFVCRDRSRACECARRADRVLTACRAYAGEYPRDWEYPGREYIMFVAERDAHEGHLRSWGVPHLPPNVRITATGGDPRARDPVVERREIYSIGNQDSPVAVE